MLLPGSGWGLAHPIPPETDLRALSPPSLRLGSDHPWVPAPLTPLTALSFPQVCGDAIRELDDSVGRILRLLQDLGIAEEHLCFLPRLTMVPLSFLRPDKAGAPADGVRRAPQLLACRPAPGPWPPGHSGLRLFPHHGGRLLHLAFHSPIRVCVKPVATCLSVFLKKQHWGPRRA